MQMMPKISWPHRVASDAISLGENTSVVLVATIPPFSVGSSGEALIVIFNKPLATN
jgi:hypothetical protein